MQKRFNVSSVRVQLTSALGLLALTGCAEVGELYEPHPVTRPIAPIASEVRADANPVALTDGSLWNGAAAHMFVDNKSFRRGDVLLVRVSQKNSGSKDANTDTARSSSFTASINRFLGLEGPINKLTGYTNNGPAGTGPTPSDKGWAPYPLVDATTDNSFKGTGTTKRSDDLQATVSAVVTEVMPNGNLSVYGHQNVTINHEASVLTVQGIVRPSDIAADNSIDAERIANADIRFDGSGVVSDKQHPGWATRALDWIMPF